MGQHISHKKCSVKPVFLVAFSQLPINPDCMCHFGVPSLSTAISRERFPMGQNNWISLNFFSISSRNVGTSNSVLIKCVHLYAVYATICSSEKICQTIANTDQPLLLLNVQCIAFNIAVIILPACLSSVFVCGIAPVTWGNDC